MNHPVRFLLASLMVFPFFIACGNRQTAATLNDIETYIQERPDSALSVIRSIDTAKLNTRSLRAHYALLHAIALDKNWIDTTDEQIVMPAIAYYNRHDSGIRRAKAWYYLGRIQQNGGSYPEASISFLKAERYAEPSDDMAFKALIYLSLSSIYSQTYFHDEALRYEEQAYNLAMAAGDTINATAALLCKAQGLFNLSRYSEADSLYCCLMDNPSLHPNLRPALLSSYALDCVTQKEDFAKAAALFEDVIYATGSLQNRNYWGAYAYALTRTGHKDRAERIFKQLAPRNGNPSLSYSHWKSLTDAYFGDYLSAYEYLKSAYDIQNENVRKALTQSAIKAQKDYLEQVRHESEQAAKKRQIATWSCCIFFFALILFLFLFFRHRNKQSKQGQQALLDAYKNLTTQMARTEEEQARIRSQYIEICQSYFKQIGRMNEILQQHTDQSENNLYLSLKNAIQQIESDEKSQEKFEALLNHSFDNVMVHFREVFPKKKDQYYRLASFFFAGFDTATILVFLPNYNMHNIHVEKSRLRQAIAKTETPYREQFLRLIL